MEMPNVEGLDEIRRQIAARVERVQHEGARAAREGRAAIEKAARAQCAAGRELGRKAGELAAALRGGDVARRFGALRGGIACAARKSADAWLTLAETSLARARRVLRAVIEQPPKAA